MVGEDDVEIRGSVPGKGYVKLMGDAYLAYRYGEIEKPGTKGASGQGPRRLLKHLSQAFGKGQKGKIN